MNFLRRFSSSFTEQVSGAARAARQKVPKMDVSVKDHPTYVAEKMREGGKVATRPSHLPIPASRWVYLSDAGDYPLFFIMAFGATLMGGFAVRKLSSDPQLQWNKAHRTQTVEEELQRTTNDTRLRTAEGQSTTQ
mmetsp:Transcript_1600/g.2296  ORF Transcript_1600/g.2296 Transcript_1600/m.2296 type:complete len:135 (-) Transcript_1600:374-778(-)|eukprot:CAMPEP_0184487190 /NCGR_PEP_ID=MMETSP0113_2-20130426/9439_1 /TAXON_ID=91329 /ORGANISM="Norrisiella sphaerica, Strain BC52" /LENGTH=134 /DNA_ID=CAMNT_0026869393 /DNA_START=86 /DNA_END=490 /DNA_ORIENTATION=+